MNTIKAKDLISLLDSLDDEDDEDSLIFENQWQARLRDDQIEQNECDGDAKEFAQN